MTWKYESGPIAQITDPYARRVLEAIDAWIKQQQAATNALGTGQSPLSSLIPVYIEGTGITTSSLGQLAGATTGVSGQYRILRCNSSGQLQVEIPGGISLSGSVDTELPAAAALADAVANPTAPLVAAYAQARDAGATTYSRISGETANAGYGGSPSQGESDDQGLHVSDQTVCYQPAVLSSVNTDYQSATSVASNALEIPRMRSFGLEFELSYTGAATNGEIELQVQVSRDNSNWRDLSINFWPDLRFEDTQPAAGTLSLAYSCEVGQLPWRYIRLNVTTTGSLSGSNYFTLAEAAFVFKN